jgi:hypothetical protein
MQVTKHRRGLPLNTFLDWCCFRATVRRAYEAFRADKASFEPSKLPRNDSNESRAVKRAGTPPRPPSSNRPFQPPGSGLKYTIAGGSAPHGGAHEQDVDPMDEEADRIISPTPQRTYLAGQVEKLDLMVTTSMQTSTSMDSTSSLEPENEETVVSAYPG